jgi:hypothetical protein
MISVSIPISVPQYSIVFIPYPMLQIHVSIPMPVNMLMMYSINTRVNMLFSLLFLIDVVCGRVYLEELVG